MVCWWWRHHRVHDGGDIIGSTSGGDIIGFTSCVQHLQSHVLRHRQLHPHGHVGQAVLGEEGLGRGSLCAMETSLSANSK